MSRLLGLSCVGLLVLACSSGDRPLQLLAGQGPVYPVDARSEGIEGWVLIGYDVNRDGRVINARVVDAEPEDIFDQAALTAVRSWRFNAPRVAGETQRASNRESRVEFRLGDASEYDDY